MGSLPSWLVPVVLGAAQLAVWPGGALLLRQSVRAGDALWGVAATVVVCAALVWRRRYPLLALAGVAAGSALGEPVGSDLALVMLSMGELVALYSVAVRCRLAVSLGSVAVLLSWHALIGLAVAGTPGNFALIEYLFVVGYGYGHRRWLEGRRAAAEQLARAEAEQQRAAVAERERLARELHDVSAHHLTSIVVTADAARRLAGKRPELAAEALDFAARTGRETLAALHRLVAVLRTVEGDDLPLSARLDELASGFNRLALDVTVDVAEGTPPALDDTLHGIAREALTNALRYAPGSRVRVGVGLRDGAVELIVDDNGAGAAPSTPSLGSGRGLAGARERAAAAGGTFSAGPRPEGGWRVRAVLPGASSGTRLSRSTMERLVDVAIVVAIAGFPALATFAADPWSAPVVAGVATAHALPLLWRRRAPWAVLGVVLATAWLAPLAIATGVAGQEVAVILAIGGAAEFVAVHAVAAYGRPGWTMWSAMPVGAAGLGAVLVAIAAVDGAMLGAPVTAWRILGTWWVTVAVLLALLAVPWGEAYIHRRRRDRVLASERGALAAAADQAVAAALAERLTIAAELRSVVLHRAAQVVTVAEEGRLDAVADEARGALGAMRELLGSLRGDEPEQSRAPQPTAAAIDALCGEYRAAGREVTLDRPADAPPLPADVDLSAFRVVEAVLGAGDTGPASVRLEYEQGGLAIVLSGVPRATVGATMAGLRARADVLGGRIAIPAVGTLRLWLPVQKDPVISSPA